MHCATTLRIQQAALVAAVVLLALAPGGPARAEPGATRVVVKLGGEHDTNVRRTVGSEVQTDESARFFLKAQLERSMARVGRLSTKLLLGAKLHRQVDDEDAFLTTAATTWRLPLGAFPAWGSKGRLAALVRADVGDRSERSSARDYFRARLLAGLGAGLHPVSLSVSAGYQVFLYKPDLESNNAGPVFEGTASVALWEGGTASAAYAYLDRRFEADRFVEIGELIALDPGTARRDDLHVLSVGLDHRGSGLASARYVLQVNRSNSFGPGLVRHVLEASWTQPLFWDVILALSGRVQRATYDDLVRIDETLQIDEENRNHIEASLSVPLAPPLWLEARYSLYTQALDADDDFMRQLLYFGLIADFDPLLDPVESEGAAR